MTPSKPCILCGSLNVSHCETISKRPRYETDYGIAENAYLRRVFQCNNCGVFLNDHSMLSDAFYQGEYNEATYADKWHSRFEFIMGLPFEKSDNKQRVARIHAFLQNRGKQPSQTKVLDIGSGLGVFSAEMAKFGYPTYVIDPDKKAVDHAINTVGVIEAWQGNLENLESCLVDQGFDFISLNKVLEHVQNPLLALRNVHKFLSANGYLYIELPDGEAAAKAEGIAARQEFCIDHLTVFSSDSLKWLVHQAGFTILEMQSICEPSGKFSIYAFIATGSYEKVSYA